MQPKISIVLPTFNGEQFLRESIDSVLDQTEANWELIIVNDCSTDATLAIASEYANRDSRISVLSNEKNMKTPTSLNRGFEKAKGEYFTWISDDNVFRPNALEKMRSFLDEHIDIDMVSMNFSQIDKNGNSYGIHDNYVESFMYERTAAQLFYLCNCGGAFMYRRTIMEKIGCYDPDFFIAEDYEYWCRIALNGNIAYTNDNVFLFRVHGNAQTITKAKKLADTTERIQKKYLNAFREKFQLTENDIAQLPFMQKEHPTNTHVMHSFKQIIKKILKSNNFCILKLLLHIPGVKKIKRKFYLKFKKEPKFSFSKEMNRLY